MNKTKNIIVVDLEATCWERDGAYQREHSEIIEIGICVLDTETGEITKNKGILVKPEKSEVSAFCTSLTTITKEMLDNEGVSFKQAINELKTDYEVGNYTWASYGAYDKNMLKKQCKLKGIEYPFGSHHLNAKEVFREASKMNKSVGMKKALSILKVPLAGTHHRGVDDANNIAKILNWCFNQ